MARERRVEHTEADHVEAARLARAQLRHFRTRVLVRADSDSFDESTPATCTSCGS
jgi:hypothetical protein